MKADSGFWVEETKDQFSFPLKRKRSFKSKKLEFVGWGSKPLIEFLQSIGRETSREYSRNEVNAIILDYVNSNNLLNPQKKKRVLCDGRLKTLFGKKSIPRIKIYDLLEMHFIENRDDSEEENSSAEEDAEEEEGSLVISKERKTSIHQKKKVQEAPKSCFAALTSQNIKLVYLKRTLVQGLLKSDDIFEDKVVGSFVRIKSDPNDFLQKNSHQLQQVTGVKKTFGSGDAGMETYLQLSNWTKDVPISSLSEDDISEEECEDLHERVKAGLLKRPTVVELELKAHVLHEDITKHWINKEIILLQRRIDHANEKGWRRELYEYLQKRQLLMKKTEQDRLLSEKPNVVAEELEPEATTAGGASERDEEKSGSPEPEQTRLFGENLKAEAEEPEKETMPLDAPIEPEKETMPLDAPEKPEMETMPLDAPKEVGGVKCFPGSTFRGPSDLPAAGMASLNLLSIQFHKGMTPSLQAATSPKGKLYSSFKEPVKESVVIELSDDEDGAAANGNQLVSARPRPEDEEIWHYLDPQGVVQGPFSLTRLSEWYEYSYFHPSFCVWKTGQSQQQSVLLVDVLRQYSMI